MMTCNLGKPGHGYGFYILGGHGKQTSMRLHQRTSSQRDQRLSARFGCTNPSIAGILLDSVC